MDVSPETIREVEFREKLRGYSQDEVDEFLERVAAGVEILQERLRQATERALRAETQAKDAKEAGGDDETLRRTLVLAQRTADLAVQEAREQAARIIEAAEGQASTIAAEAYEKARAMAEEAQSQVWADVGRLEAAREQLRQDVGALARYLESERARAQEAFNEAATRVAHMVHTMAAPPALHDLDLTSVQAWARRPAPANGTLPAEGDPAGASPGVTQQPTGEASLH